MLIDNDNTSFKLSSDLLLYFQDDMKILDMWNINGGHYEKTLNKWLENLDQNKDKVLESLRPTYGKDAELMMTRWRAFFIYCAETWGFQYIFIIFTKTLLI